MFLLFIDKLKMLIFEKMAINDYFCLIITVGLHTLLLHKHTQHTMI